MSYIDWSERFNLGLPTLDGDHRTLAELLNRVVETLGPDGDGDTLPILDKLIGAARTHFQREEALLDQLHYPGLPNHRFQHQRLLAQIDHFRARVAGGAMPRENPPVIADWLRRWLFDHIQDADKAYRPFVMRLA